MANKDLIGGKEVKPGGRITTKASTGPKAASTIPSKSTAKPSMIQGPFGGGKKA